MKLTSKQLKRIINEEVKKLIEGEHEGHPRFRIGGGNPDTSLLEREPWWPQLFMILQDISNGSKILSTENLEED